MAKISYNVTETGDYLTVPGNYAAKISKVEVTASKAGNPMLVVTLSTKEGSIRDNIMLSGKGAFKLIDLTKAVNLKLKDSGSFDADKLLGKKVGITVADQPDSDFTQVTSYLSAEQYKAASSRVEEEPTLIIEEDEEEEELEADDWG